MNKQHHVIIGGSAAGVSAALAMRDNGFDGRITLIDAGSEVPYERPPLSKSTDLNTVHPIAPDSTYVENDIDLLLGHSVIAVESDQTVILDSGERLHADALLLATGGTPRKLGVPGEDLDNVLMLRDIDDARAFATRLKTEGPFVIIGGGFIGLEAAAVAREKDMDVTVVEAMSIPLAGVLGTKLATVVRDIHANAGVRILTGRVATEFKGSGAVEQVVLDDGTTIAAATVLVGVGVIPNDALARGVGVHCDNGIVVDDYGQTNVPWIWAAGDVANFFSPFTGRRQRIEHWDVARRHGAAVGASMAGVFTANTAAPYFWSEQYGLRLQMYGRAKPGDELVLRLGESTNQMIAFWVNDSVLSAAAALDSPGELRAAKVLIEERIPVDVAELTDPGVSLKSLARQRSRNVGWASSITT
ncbi:FAD-dependent oxidoreductase [Metapseudomonas furukawaii]|uniref:NAD(P)/FAD-dependent oxidoreductase n=1 Tax=Metapseudomonas furukawaii TaxID=1149133 RepID=UPI00227BB390|nr:FAD-dependent oxidoreductase [Pseudomonas furukawaii]WAG81559.1 FAD-dependent oxidoreductase [Pseudomonas furukawaii]